MSLFLVISEYKEILFCKILNYYTFMQSSEFIFMLLL